MIDERYGTVKEDTITTKPVPQDEHIKQIVRQEIAELERRVQLLENKQRIMGHKYDNLNN